jgi:hypothetical protein
MLFSKRDEGQRAEAVRRVKAWVSSYARAQEGDVVMVTELQCTEEGCPPIETVLALLRRGEEPRKWKVHKAIALVTEEDVCAAIDSRHELVGR